MPEKYGNTGWIVGTSMGGCEPVESLLLFTEFGLFHNLQLSQPQLNSILVATTSLPAVYRPNGYARTTTAGTPHACAKIAIEQKCVILYCLFIFFKTNSL